MKQEELNIDERMEMRLFSYKGYQLTQDSDLDVLLNNCALFVLIGSIIKLLLDANFDPHNYLVPYTQIKSLGKVIIG